ncbi:hypothetical protein LINPERPRIM_LOCUS29249 [Linum perenne]
MHWHVLLTTRRLSNRTVIRATRCLVTGLPTGIL